MSNLIPWLMFAIAIVAMSTLIGILLWYTGLTESTGTNQAATVTSMTYKCHDIEWFNTDKCLCCELLERYEHERLA